MRFLILVIFVLACAVSSPTPLASVGRPIFRAQVRNGIEVPIPATEPSVEHVELWRETCALPDSAYRN